VHHRAQRRTTRESQVNVTQRDPYRTLCNLSPSERRVARGNLSSRCDRLPSRGIWLGWWCLGRAGRGLPGVVTGPGRVRPKRRAGSCWRAGRFPCAIRMSEMVVCLAWASWWGQARDPRGPGPSSSDHRAGTDACGPGTATGRGRPDLAPRAIKGGPAGASSG